MPEEPKKYVWNEVTRLIFIKEQDDDAFVVIDANYGRHGAILIAKINLDQYIKCKLFRHAIPQYTEGHKTIKEMKEALPNVWKHLLADNIAARDFFNQNDPNRTYEEMRADSVWIDPSTKAISIRICDDCFLKHALPGQLSGKVIYAQDLCSMPGCTNHVIVQCSVS